MTDFLRDLFPMFGHAATRAGHAQQLKPTYKKIENDVASALGLATNYPQISQTLEEYLSLGEDEWFDIKTIQDRIQTHLPSANDPKQAISFSRLKDVESLSEKMKAQRGTADAYGIQIWLNDPTLMWKVEAFDSKQHPQNKHWKRKNRPIELVIDSHMGKPKGHGYRALHMEFTCQAAKGWSEKMELQVMPREMMATYLHTRAPYKVLTALEKIVKAETGNNQNYWSNEERAIIYPLRDYIRALYEADTYKCGLMGMLHHGESPDSANQEAALQKASSLHKTVESIVYAYLGGYKDDPKLIFTDAQNILPNDYSWPKEHKPKPEEP